MNDQLSVWEEKQCYLFVKTQLEDPSMYYSRAGESCPCFMYPGTINESAVMIVENLDESYVNVRILGSERVVRVMKNKLSCHKPWDVIRARRKWFCMKYDIDFEELY